MAKRAGDLTSNSVLFLARNQESRSFVHQKKEEGVVARGDLASQTRLAWLLGLSAGEAGRLSEEILRERPALA